MKLGTAPQPPAGSIAAPAMLSPRASVAPGAELPPPPPPVHDVPQHQPPASAEAIKQAAAQINEFLRSSAAASVEFTVDGTSDHVVVRVVDTETNQVIRQMPSEETLAISRALDHLSGLLLRQRA